MFGLHKITEKTSIFNIMHKYFNSYYNQDNANDEFAIIMSKKYANYAWFGEILINEKDIGFVAIYCNNHETKNGYISMIVVGKEYQGNGYGSLALNEISRISREHGMNSLMLEVDKNNKKAISLYKKHGYVIIEEKKKSYIMKVNI